MVTTTQIRETTTAATVRTDLSGADLRAALADGWRDFLAHPAFGLFFAAIYVAGGLALTYTLVVRGELAWLVLAVAGFPILAPFTAVGFYEISRRREAGLPVTWGAVLGAVRGRGDDQILMMGVVVFMSFGFWIVLARGVFAIFSSSAGYGLSLSSASLSMFTSGPGLAMLFVGSIIGAMVALAFFSITVVSLPMLVDRPVDFITAIITSLATMRANLGTMLAWAALIATLLFLAMLPLFLGLFLVLPLLGHATWHLYRRAVEHRMGLA